MPAVNPQAGAKPAPVKQEPIVDREVAIRVPVDSDPAECIRFGYHVSMMLTEEQTRLVHRLCKALDRRQAVTKVGRRVLSKNDAIRWLLDQAATAATAK